MATNVAKIQAELDLDSGKFTGTITSAVGQLKTFNAAVSNTDKSLKNIERRVTGLGASLRDTMVILGQFRAAMHTLWMFSGQWVGQIVEANAKLERLQQLMKGLSKSTTEVGKTTDALRDMNYVLEQAKNAPFAVDVIADAFVKLKASGIDPTRGSLQALTDAVAHFGGTSEQLHRATIAIQQMSGKGVISMEELRQQLGEAVPNAMQLMARATGMTMGQLVKTISTGRLEASGALEKLFAEMKLEFGGSSKEMMNTWTGMVAKLKTEWLIFAKEIGDQGLFAQAKSSLAELVAFMGSVEGKALAKDIGQALAVAVKAAADLARWLVENRDELVSWAKIIGQVFIASKVVQFGGALISAGAQVVTFTRTMGQLGVAMTAARAGTLAWSSVLSAAAGPIGIAITAITSLVFYLNEQHNAAVRAGNAMQDYYNKTAKGEVVSPDEHAGMQKRLDYLNRVKKALDEAKGSDKGNQYARERHTDKLNALTQEGRELGIIQDRGNKVADAFGTLTGKINFLEEAYVANVGAAASNVAKQSALQYGKAAEDTVRMFGTKLEQSATKAMPQISGQLANLWDQLNKGEIKQAEYDSKRTDLLGGAIDRKIEAIKSARTTLQIQYENALSQHQETKHIGQMIDEANRQLESAQQERSGVNSAVNLLPKMGFGGDGKPKIDEYKNLYDTLIGKQAELQAKLDGDTAIPKLERFQAMVKEGAYQGNSGLIGAIETLYKSLDQLEEKVKKNKATETLKDDLTEMEAKAKADVISANIAASGDVYNQVAAGMVGFNRQVEVLRANLDKTNMSREEFDQWVVNIKDHIAQVDFINFQKFVQDTEWENYLSSLPERSRRVEEFNKRLQELELTRKNMKANDPNRAAQIDQGINDLIESETGRFRYENRSEWEKWLDDYADITEEMDSMWANTMDNFSKSMSDALTEGSADWKSFATSVLKEITRIVTSKVVSELVNLALSFFGGGTSMGAGPYTGGGTGPGSNASFGNNVSNFSGGAYANGGIHGPDGSLPLHKYAKGGIANSPQYALFGEGRLPEAYVPLPDGRSIPVSMEGGGGVQNNVTIAVTINQDGSATSKTDASQSGREFGQMLDMKVRQVIGDEMRPGGILWRMKNGG